MRNELLEALKTIAPQVVFTVAWEPDHHCSWDGDGPDPREEGYQPHDVTVTARTIIKGEMVENFPPTSLGSCWDKPGELDPDIHGYLPQMLEEAATELQERISAGERVWPQLEAAKEYLKKVMKRRYTKQMA